jgi:hypothetical protein
MRSEVNAKILPLFPARVTLYALKRRLGWSQMLSEWVQKTLNPLGFDSRTVQPVAGRCTDYAIPG